MLGGVGLMLGAWDNEAAIRVSGGNVGWGGVMLG